jgi:hypothetical protein
MCGQEQLTKNITKARKKESRKDNFQKLEARSQNTEYRINAKKRGTLRLAEA